MKAKDDSLALIDCVKEAAAHKVPVRIVGGDSKCHLGHVITDSKVSDLRTSGHTGIISYEPTELVVTVRAGTPLVELSQVLADAGQMLPFEPPVFPNSTIGGVVACGLSGPRRPFNGSVRDYVLGTRVINGKAQDLAFGGEVMKNVAGYDVSRLQVGAWGTLGVLLDISMKVLPQPEFELTVQQSVPALDEAGFAALLRQPLPLSGAMLIGDQRYVRLSGSESAVRAAARQLGGEETTDSMRLWSSVRDHTHAFFTGDLGTAVLWRISVPDHAPPLALTGQWLHEWAGAQRWLKSEQSADDVFRVVAAAGGHAIRYSATMTGVPAFQPLQGAMRRLQSRVRDSFDADRLFNRGRFHPELDTLEQHPAEVSA